MKTILTYLSVISLLLLYSCTEVEKIVYVDGLGQVHTPEEGKGTLVVYSDNIEDFIEDRKNMVTFSIQNHQSTSLPQLNFTIPIESENTIIQVYQFFSREDFYHIDGETYYIQNNDTHKVRVLGNLLPGKYVIGCHYSEQMGDTENHYGQNVTQTYGVVEVIEGEITSTVIKWFDGELQQSYLDHVIE